MSPLRQPHRNWRANGTDLPIYHPDTDNDGLPWVDVAPYRHRILPTAHVATVQSGAYDEEVPIVTPVCTCRPVLAWTRRGAARRAGRVHNRRAVHRLCAGQYVFARTIR
jgi:hypothetical protein